MTKTSYQVGEQGSVVRAIVAASQFTEDKPYGATAGVLYFATRENGDVGEERPGREDVAAAKSLRAKIAAAVPTAKVEIDTCDEWVNLVVTLAAGS